VTFKEYDPATADPSELYSLLVGCVVPRPIAFVSSLSADGVANLAPFSFFNAGGAHPPSLVFSPVTSGAGRNKDTLNNIRATREYVVHIAPWGLREKMNQSSADYDSDVDEFVEAGFTKVASKKVKPWRVAESPVAMECRLFQIVEHGSGPLRANYVIGEVVYFHLAESLFVNGRIDYDALDAIGRLGGPFYTHVTKDSVFKLARPVLPAK
jgi:flavin reductase (DIM6/NTAB) family NADH-FMN oxidoreductase RutF